MLCSHAKKRFLLHNQGIRLTFKAGCVVLYPGQVQVVVPSLCVLINTVVLAIRRQGLQTLLRSYWTEQTQL